MLFELKSGWWLTPLLIAVMSVYDLAATEALVAAILIHELAHAMAALTVGSRPRRLILGLFPAVAVENPHNRVKNAWIALAAPLANFVLFVWFGFNHLPMWSAGHLVVFAVAIVPYPGSDSWQAFRSREC